jgi:N-acetylneuraminic acid mutarotase
MCVATTEAETAYGTCEGEVLPSTADGGCISDAGARHDSSAGDAQAGGAAVLFGGVTGTGMLTDTWTFDGTAWAQDSVAGPSGAAGRGNAVMAPLDGLAVLFGGYNYGSSGSGAFYSDTWTWNGAAWTQLSVTGPSARCDAVMAPFDGKIVLFGGFYAEGSTFTNLGDTWTWDGTTWAQVSDTGPSGRDQAVMAALGSNLVLFGGVGATNIALGDTWIWDGTAWTQLSVTGPSPRTYSVMQPLGGKLVLFGGLAQGDGGHNYPLSDTWTWDGTAWAQVSVAGPSARSVSVMTPLDGKLLLFGGEDVDGNPLSDTWTWDGTAWAQISVTGPPGRYWSEMTTP